MRIWSDLRWKRAWKGRVASFAMDGRFFSHSGGVRRCCCVLTRPSYDDGHVLLGTASISKETAALGVQEDDTNQFFTVIIQQDHINRISTPQA